MDESPTSDSATSVIFRLAIRIVEPSLDRFLSSRGRNSLTAILKATEKAGEKLLTTEYENIMSNVSIRSHYVSVALEFQRNYAPSHFHSYPKTLRRLNLWKCKRRSDEKTENARICHPSLGRLLGNDAATFAAGNAKLESARGLRKMVRNGT